MELVKACMKLNGCYNQFTNIFRGALNKLTNQPSNEIHSPQKGIGKVCFYLNYSRCVVKWRV